MYNVLIYRRVSSKGQADGHGFERQADTTEAFCAKMGFTILGTFDDVFTGASDGEDRPAFMEMLVTAVESKVDGIVIENIDRLARTYIQCEQLATMLIAKGFDVWGAATGANFKTEFEADPWRKAVIQIQGIFAEAEKRSIVIKLRRAREAVRRKLQERSGKKEVKLEGRKSHLEKHPALAEFVGELLVRNPKISLTGLADALNGSEFEAQSKDGVWTRFSARNVMNKYKAI